MFDYKANYLFLREAKEEIFEYLLEFTETEFDGSPYTQGKKDGLRIALTILGDDWMKLLATNKSHPMYEELFGKEEKTKNNKEI